MKAIDEAVLLQYATDDAAALRALLTGGLWDTTVPENALVPHACFSSSSVSEKTFGEDIKIFFIEFCLTGSTKVMVNDLYDALRASFEEKTFPVTGWSTTMIKEESSNREYFQKRWEYRVVFRVEIETGSTSVPPTGDGTGGNTWNLIGF